MAKTARIEKIEAMLADDPDDPTLRYMLGMEHAGGGDDAAAVAVFRDIIRRTAASPYVPAYHMAGQALARLGRDAEACEVLRQGVAAARAAGDHHAAGEMEGLLASIE